MDLREKVARLELARVQEKLARLRGEKEPVHVPNELEDSVYLRRVPVNSGPEYLTVTASIWGPKPRIHVDGTPVRNLKEAREIAHKRGLKGITVEVTG